jgi:ceramide glucosyltransferase
VITAILAAVYAALLLLKATLAGVQARRTPPGEGDPARVSVAQPILGGDPGLAAVLEDDLRALPEAQFLWLVDTDDPEGRAVCEAVRRRNPERRIEILIFPPAPEGHNPKLHKLEGALAAAREPVLLVLDDDTRMPRATLAALAGALGAHDLATGLPGYLDDGRWPSRLLAQFVNDNAAMTYLPLLGLVPPVTINGMAYALRRERLEALGGFAPVLRHLTDDLAVARHVLQAGGRIFQSARVQWVQTTVRDLRHYRQLMHRWFLFALLLLRRQPAWFRAVIALLHGLPPLLLWGALLAALASPGILAWCAVAALLGVRALALAALQRRIYGRTLHAPVLSLLGELLQPAHLVHAALVRRIVWRTRRYLVRDEADFVPLP